MKYLKKRNKGSYQYLINEKYRRGLLSFIGLLLVLSIYLFGFFKYDHAKNIFTVVAAVSSLPVIKEFISFIILLPYKSETTIFNTEDILYDILLTDTNIPFYLGACLITDKNIICYNKNYTDKKIKKGKKLLRSYLNELSYLEIYLLNNTDDFSKMIKDSTPSKKEELSKISTLIFNNSF